MIYVLFTSVMYGAHRAHHKSQAEVVFYQALRAVEQVAVSRHKHGNFVFFIAVLVRRALHKFVYAFVLLLLICQPDLYYPLIFTDVNFQ